MPWPSCSGVLSAPPESSSWNASLQCRRDGCGLRLQCWSAAIATAVLVVDASAVAELVLGTVKGRAVAVAIGDHTLHAPELMPLEVASVLRGLVRAGEIQAGELPQLLANLAALGVELYEHLPLLGRVMDLRDNATVYDAIYLALAEVLDAPLLTCDKKLATVAGTAATVHVV